jgi:predicted nucleic acid-binding Zn ribbon protein
MTNLSHRGPRALSEVLGELFTTRGYGRLRAIGELEKAWNTAVGEPDCQRTRIGEVRHGVLSVTVAHPTLLEELAAFRKGELLEALRASVPAMVIHDVRFRVGMLDDAHGEGAEISPHDPQGSQSAQRGGITHRSLSRCRRRLHTRRNHRGAEKKAE